MHELCILITSNPFGSFIIILSLIWATERVIVAFINRNKQAACECDCCAEETEDEDE